MSKYFTTRTLVTTALMIALSVILRLIGFPQTGVFRIEFGFLPIAAVSYLYGPLTGGLSYVLADIVGTFFSGSTPFLPITACKFLYGIVFGLLFYKKKVGLKENIIANLIIFFIIDLILMTFALLPISGGKTLFAIFITRLWVGLINVVLRVGSIWLMFKYFDPKKIGGNKS